jgi:hypothetical protein
MISTNRAVITSITEGNGPHGPYLRWLFTFFVGGICSKITNTDPATGGLAIMLKKLNVDSILKLEGKTVFVNYFINEKGFRQMLNITTSLAEAKEYGSYR